MHLKMLAVCLHTKSRRGVSIDQSIPTQHDSDLDDAPELFQDQPLRTQTYTPRSLGWNLPLWSGISISACMKQHMPGFKNSLIAVPVLLLGLPSTSSCLNLGLTWQEKHKSGWNPASVCASAERRKAQRCILSYDKKTKHKWLGDNINAI